MESVEVGRWHHSNCRILHVTTTTPAGLQKCGVVRCNNASRGLLLFGPAAREELHRHNRAHEEQRPDHGKSQSGHWYQAAPSLWRWRARAAWTGKRRFEPRQDRPLEAERAINLAADQDLPQRQRHRFGLRPGTTGLPRFPNKIRINEPGFLDGLRTDDSNVYPYALRMGSRSGAADRPLAAAGSVLEIGPSSPKRTCGARR